MTAVSDVKDALRSAAPRLGDTTLVCVDGRSGAGKTALTTAVLHGVDMPVQVLGVDQVCPGWRGLPDVADLLLATLRPLQSGLPGTIETWDWNAGRPGPSLTLEPGGLLVLEGAGSYARSYADAVSLLVWVECEPELRRQRALDRDGPLFEPHWDAWAADEELVHEREGTRAAADVVVRTDGRD